LNDKNNDFKFKKKFDSSKKLTEKKKVPKLAKTMTCFHCGAEGHGYKDENCPARNATCRKCSLKGHYDRCCRTKEERIQQLKQSNYLESVSWNTDKNV